ncbi:MAG: PAS domain S-box protein [Marinilabiliaceae bacterium]|nr:PAS domain S-box protein [Marinilabiliaceae bacterium]
MEGIKNKILELEANNRKLKQKNDELAQALFQASVAKDSLQALCDEFEVQLKHIQESESKLKKLFRLSYDAILFLNEKGTILDCNDACLRMFGYEDKQAFIGKTTLEITPACDHEITQRYLTKLINNKGHQRIEKYFLTRNGKEFPALVSSSKIDKQSGIISSVIQDLSLQKKYEQEQTLQINLLTRQNSVQQEIQKASSTQELKTHLCHILLKHTGANSVWLMVTRDDCVDSLYYSQQQDGGYVHSQVPCRKQEPHWPFTKADTCLNGRVMQLKDDAIIYLPELNQSSNVLDQLLFVTKLKSGKKYFWGANYETVSNGTMTDKAVLQHISPQLASAFDSLDAYEQLTENELRFRALIEKSDDIIVIRNEVGEYTYVSPSIRKYGLEPEDIIGKSAIHFVHPDDMQRILTATNELLPVPGGSCHLENIRLILPHSIIAHAHVTMTNQLDQNGINGFVINIKDVSETFRYEKQLRESEEKYRILFENGSGGIARSI